MTAGLITQFGPISDVATLKTPNASESGNNFLEVFKASADKNSEPDTTSVETVDKKKVETETDKPQNSKTKEDEKDVVENETSVEEKVVAEDADEIKEEVQEAVASVLDAVAAVLDVPVQVVEEAVETLGLEAVDLLDSSNVPQVVVEIEGADDVVDIMTDENLFANVKEISQMVDEVAEDLSEELKVPVQEVKETAKEIVSVEETEVTAEIEQMPITNTESGRKASNDTNSNAGDQMNFTQSFVENIKAAVVSEESETVAYATDMNEIYSQVSESLKVNISEDVTEMEINLHPASLGNVKINIAERDGLITANFTTENEQVKAALETQIVELKESMDEQGLKVESIEVTLASHAFEENLNKEGNNAPSEEETKKKRRSINLNEIDESDDIIIEDDVRIAREMMMHNGTTVDYMA